MKRKEGRKLHDDHKKKAWRKEEHNVQRQPEQIKNSSFDIENNLTNLGYNGTFRVAIQGFLSSLQESGLTAQVNNYKEFFSLEIEKTEKDPKYKVDYKKLENARNKMLANIPDKQKVVFIEQEIKKIQQNFPKEFQKLQQVFVQIGKIKDKKQLKETLQKVSSKLGINYEELKNIFAIQDSEEKKNENNEIDNKKNIEKIINSLPQNIKNAAESNIKPLDKILSEIVLGKDSAQVTEKLQQKTTLKENYHKVKKHYLHWQNKNAQDVYQWAERHKGKLNGDNIYEAIAVTDRANNLVTGGHNLRDTQILSVLTFLETSNNQGRLCQISTGEGKTTIVALLAAIKALQGETVDIITSNTVLAAEGLKEKTNFYGLFGLTVATNNPEKDEKYTKGKKESYSADILYGSISNFQFDYLRDSFEGLETRGDRKFGTVILDEVDSMLIDNGGHIAKLSGPLPGMESLRYIYIKIWQELNKESVNLFHNQPKTKEDYNNQLNDIKVKVNQAVKLLESEQALIPKHLKQYANDKLLKWVDIALYALFDCHEDQQYVIKNNETAKDEEEKQEQVIVPVDYANTGVTMQNTIWSNGLHQFLQLKHNLRLTSENLTSSFVSNLGYIHKYGSEIYGLTGTLGSVAEQELLSTIYSIDYAKIPTYKVKKFKELPYVVEQDSQWHNNVVVDTILEVERGRASLIICETIKDLKEIEAKIKFMQERGLANKIKIRLYIDENNSNITENSVDTGDVIIATNIAGRGTDLKTTPALEKNGGLHVCVAFLPDNKRVEDQAFGRTSRQGNEGTAKLIIRASEVAKLGIKYSPDIKYMKLLRDEGERERIKNIQDKKIGELVFKDKLFEQFSALYRDLKDKNEEIPEFYYVLSDLKEYWAFWLEREEQVQQKGINKLTKEAAETLAISKYKDFREIDKVQKIIEGIVQHNPYYCIQQAEHFLINSEIDKAKISLEQAIDIDGVNGDILHSAYIKLFEIAMEGGGVILERFKSAMEKVAIFGNWIPVKNENYKVEAEQYLEKAKNALNRELSYFQEHFSNSNKGVNSDFVNILISRPTVKENTFVKHLESRGSCLNVYLQNVMLLQKEIKECESRKGLSINSKVHNYLKNFDPTTEDEKKLKNSILDSELSELNYVGLGTNYALKEVHDVPDEVIHRAQGQILGGLAALSSGIVFPPALPVLGPVAGVLISEGVCDIVMELISQGDTAFDEQEYAKGKAISYGISIATMGIAAIATCTKILNKAIKACRELVSVLKTSSIMKDICTKVANHIEKIGKWLEKVKIDKLAHAEQLKNLSMHEKFASTIKTIIMETATSAATSIATEKMLNPLLSDIMSSLKPKIKEQVKEALANNIDSKKLASANQEIINKTISEIMSGTLAEAAEEVAKKIALGVISGASNPKLKLASLVIDTALSGVKISEYAFKFAMALDTKLSIGSERNIVQKIIDDVSDQITEKIYGLVVNLTTNVVTKLPQIASTLAKDTLKDKKDEKQPTKVINHHEDAEQVVMKRHALNDLGLDGEATASEIRRAYLLQALKHHPDKSGGSHAAFQKIQAAHDFLTNKTKKYNYQGFKSEQESMRNKDSTSKFKDTSDNADSLEHRLKINPGFGKNACVLNNSLVNFLGLPKDQEGQFISKYGIYGSGKGTSVPDAKIILTKMGFAPVTETLPSKSQKQHIDKFLITNTTDRAMLFVKGNIDGDVGHAVIVKKIKDQLVVSDYGAKDVNLLDFLKNYPPHQITIMGSKGIDDSALIQKRASIVQNETQSSLFKFAATGEEDGFLFGGTGDGDFTEKRKSRENDTVHNDTENKKAKQLGKAGLSIDTSKETLKIKEDTKLKLIEPTENEQKGSKKKENVYKINGINDLQFTQDDLLKIVQKAGAYTPVDRTSFFPDPPDPTKKGVTKSTVKQISSNKVGNIEMYVFKQGVREQRTALAELISHNKIYKVKDTYLIKDDQDFVIRVNNPYGNDVCFAPLKFGIGTEDAPYTFTQGFSYSDIRKILADKNNKNYKSAKILDRNLNLAERARNDLAGVLLQIDKKQTITTLNKKENGVGGVEAMKKFEEGKFDTKVKNHPDGKTIGEIVTKQFVDYINAKLPGYLDKDFQSFEDLCDQILAEGRETPAPTTSTLQGLDFSEKESIGMSIIDANFYQYTLDAIRDALKLRITNAKLDGVAILEGNYKFINAKCHNFQKLLTDLAFTNSEIILVAINLYNKHAVAIIAVKDLTKDSANLFYIDPSNAIIPSDIKQIFDDSGINNIEQLIVEQQKYTNCGPEVIENFMLYLTGERLTQEDAIQYHSMLFEANYEI